MLAAFSPLECLRWLRLSEHFCFFLTQLQAALLPAKTSLSDNQPGSTLRRNGNGNDNVISPIELIYLCFHSMLLNEGSFLEARVIEWQPDVTGNRLAQRVVYQSHTAQILRWVHVQDAIPVSSIRSTEMDNIRSLRIALYFL